jgi:nucleotide-binding universal stress UspA family protein
MSGIVCAIRGGPASKPTIKRSISLSKETGCPIYFLYIVNLDFLKHASSSHLSSITEDMREMGEFILLSAQANAASKGVTAEGVIRDGEVEEEINKLCREVEANYLVVGQPQTNKKQKTVFSQARLDQFIQRVEQDVGVKVVIASGSTDAE